MNSAKNRTSLRVLFARVRFRVITSIPSRLGRCAGVRVGPLLLQWLSMLFRTGTDRLFLCHLCNSARGRFPSGSTPTLGQATIGLILVYARHRSSKVMQLLPVDYSRMLLDVVFSGTLGYTNHSRTLQLLSPVPFPPIFYFVYSDWSAPYRTSQAPICKVFPVHSFFKFISKNNSSPRHAWL